MLFASIWAPTESIDRYRYTNIREEAMIRIRRTRSHVLSMMTVVYIIDETKVADESDGDFVSNGSRARQRSTNITITIPHTEHTW